MRLHFCAPFFGACLLSLGLQACDGLSFSDQVTSNERTPSDLQPQGTPGLQALLVEKEDPNSFEVHIELNNLPRDGQALVLRRKDGAGNQTQLDLLSSQATEYTDSTVKAGTKYTYGVANLKSDGLEELATADIQVPTDIEIVGAINWPASEITGINRLFFRKDARLVTQGQQFRIVVRKIISDDGVIESWPDGQTAPRNTAGRSGGLISIETDVGEGRLQVLARGENGGQGLNGSPGGAGAVGPRGNNAEVKSETDCPFSFIPNFLLREGPGHCHTQYYCSRQTGDGGQGNQGFPGTPGARGLPGGDAAEVHILVHADSALQVVHSLLPGQGGAGGIGGPGGPGGGGGPPGSRDSGNRCRAANWGSAGPQGHGGSSGDLGVAGALRPVCVKLGSSQVGDC